MVRALASVVPSAFSATEWVTNPDRPDRVEGPEAALLSVFGVLGSPFWRTDGEFITATILRKGLFGGTSPLAPPITTVLNFH